MIRLHPRSTRTEHTLALHDALPILLLRKRGKHPTTTFSRTVPSPNNSRFWNVRVTPISDSRCTGRPSRSWPSYSTAPYVGLRIRLKQFNSVVLPAPLGPMRPTIEPEVTSKLTSSTALRPAKCTDSPLTARSGLIAVPSPTQVSAPECWPIHPADRKYTRRYLRL